MSAVDQRETDLAASGLGLLTEPLALNRLLAVSLPVFAEQYWGRQALLSSSADLGGDFTDLLDEDAVDELVSRRGLRTPFLRVAKDGTTYGDRAFTAPAGVGATINDQVSDDKLVRLFADGATIVLQALHRVWPPVIDFCQQLAAELGHPVQANAYVTPPQSRGFDDHYDVHDVFVLQLAGRKRWSIHEPVHPSPLRSQPWTDRRADVQRRAAEPAVIDTVLEPGDCLYLPRGFLHAATALGGVSAHLTIGVHSWTRYGVAEKLLAEALRTAAADPQLRTSLPLGVDIDDPGSWSPDFEHVRAAVLDAVAALPAESLAAALRADDQSTQRAAPIGPLRQLRDAGSLGEGDRLELRPHLKAVLDSRGGHHIVRSRAGDVTVTDPELAAAQSFLDRGHASAAELGTDLARKLLLAGLARSV